MRPQFGRQVKVKEPTGHERVPPAVRTAITPAHRILQLQRLVGNHAVMRLLSSDRIRISQPGDRQEEEAERVATQVMRMRDDAVASEPAGDEDARPQEESAPARRDRPQGEEESDIRVDRVRADGEPPAGSDIRPDVASGLDRLHGAGQALPDPERSFFEPRFGVNFGGIRVHTDDHADQLARAVEARAFAVQNHIVFRSGEFKPGTHEGRRLLAHELTHSVQQGAAAPGVARRAGVRSPTGDPSIDPIPTTLPAAVATLQRTVTGLAVAGAAAEAGLADHFVAPRGGAAIVVTATVSAPGLQVNWTGGSPQPGNNLQRRVPTNPPRNVAITADTPADPGSSSVTVHVVNGVAAPANTPAQLRFSRQPGDPPGLAPFGLTDVRTNAPVPRIRAFVTGNQWEFRVEQISHRYQLGVTGGLNTAGGVKTNIDTAANATNANHCRVITDLTPPAVGAATGPLRADFWSRRITTAHENAHVSRFYSPPFWEAFMRTAETTIEAPASNVNVDHTVAATLSAAGIVAANAAGNQATIDAQHAAADAAEIVGAEVFAHDQSNPMYTTLNAQVAARFRPLAPTALAAVATAPTSVQLNWTHNACNDTEYRVHRRRGTGAFAQIATLPAGAVAFTDTLAGLAGNTDFTYFVTAAGVAGQSARSNQVAVHTP